MAQDPVLSDDARLAKGVLEAAFTPAKYTLSVEHYNVTRGSGERARERLYDPARQLLRDVTFAEASRVISDLQKDPRGPDVNRSLQIISVPPMYIQTEVHQAELKSPIAITELDTGGYTLEHVANVPRGQLYVSEQQNVVRYGAAELWRPIPGGGFAGPKWLAEWLTQWEWHLATEKSAASGATERRHLQFIIKEPGAAQTDRAQYHYVVEADSYLPTACAVLMEGNEWGTIAFYRLENIQQEPGLLWLKEVVRLSWNADSFTADRMKLSERSIRPESHELVVIVNRGDDIYDQRGSQLAYLRIGKAADIPEDLRRFLRFSERK